MRLGIIGQGFVGSAMYERVKELLRNSYLRS